nr:MAG TPA: Protein of unknown function (DUF3688) [Caudoviricetes sp.]
MFRKAEGRIICARLIGFKIYPRWMYFSITMTQKDRRHCTCGLSLILSNN